MQKVNTIEEYFSGFPEETRKILQQVRETIKAAAPQAEELISYGMPTYKLQVNLVHFAANAKHIGFYPTPSGIEEFKNEFDGYKWSKGAVQFPIGKPMPLDLIRRIVQFRVKEVNKSHR